MLGYFRSATAITAEPPEKELKTIKQIIHDIWENRDRDYNIRCLVRRLQRIDKQMSGEAREIFVAYIPNGDMATFAAGLATTLRKDFTGTMSLLRKPDFQDLLVNYPRAPRTFIIGYEVQDEVSSAWLVSTLATLARIELFIKQQLPFSLLGHQVDDKHNWNYEG